MKRKYYLLILIFLISLGSCENYLEPKPTDFLNPQNYYETTAQLQFARASVYHNLGAGGLHGTYANYLLAWHGDEAYMNRSSLTSGPWNYFYSSADTYTNGVWTNLWNGINRANVVLANLCLLYTSRSIPVIHWKKEHNCYLPENKIDNHFCANYSYFSNCQKSLSVH